MSENPYHVVFNAKSGSALASGLTAETLRQQFLDNEIAVDLSDEPDADLSEQIKRAMTSDAEVIVAAGGDGTVTALANALAGSGKTLALLPLGTANLLARDLGIPLELDKAIASMGEMQPRRIDVGEVNGRIFLHKVVIGLIPNIAEKREEIRGDDGFAARFAFARYLFGRIAQARRIAVEIASDKQAVAVRRVHALAIANNAYDEAFGRFFSRQCLDGGSLSLYVLKHLSVTDFLRLATEMLLGRWTNDSALEIEQVQSVTIRRSRRPIKVMIDGEVEVLNGPLAFQIRPLALSVLAPVAAATPADEKMAEDAK